MEKTDIVDDNCFLVTLTTTIIFGCSSIFWLLFAVHYLLTDWPVHCSVECRATRLALKKIGSVDHTLSYIFEMCGELF